MARALNESPAVGWPGFEVEFFPLTSIAEAYEVVEEDRYLVRSYLGLMSGRLGESHRLK